MDFGKLEDITDIDFSLTATNPFTFQCLKPQNQPQKFDIWTGPSVWVNKDWIGKIYPSRSSDKDFLYHYSRQFNVIELNVTHYQIPSDATIARWKAQVPPTFRFCPKWPQLISHERQLRDCEVLSREFVRVISLLDSNLGLTFLQLAPTFSAKQFSVFSDFLDIIPDGFPLAVEFRHPDWFSNTHVWQKTLELLHKKNISTVMTDVAGRRDVLHQSLTTSTLVLRFVGNELHPTDYTRTDAWVARIAEWQQQGLRQAYVFVHCGENKLAPELTKYWIETLNQSCDTLIAPPRFLPQVVQGSLF